MKRLVVVTTRDLSTIGGIERYLTNLIQNFQHRDLEIFLLSRQEDAAVTEDAKSDRKRYFKVHVRPYKNFFRFLNPLHSLWITRRYIAHAIKELRPDIILTRDWDAVLSVAGIIRDIPVFFMPGSLLKMDLAFDHTTQGSGSYRASRWIQSQIRIGLEGLAFRVSTHIIVFSHAFRKRVQSHYHVPEEKISVIPMGIDLPSPDPNIPLEKGMILCVGRLSKSKNFQAVIEAMSGLEGFRLYIAGEGPFRKALEQKIQDLKLNSQVILLGKQEDLKNYYQRCEVFIHPSYYENLGQVLLEAMFYGKPPIVLDPTQKNVHTASSELIQDGYNGFFVKNEPDAIQKKIKEVVQLPQQPLQNRCQEFAKQFTFYRHLEQLLELLSQRRQNETLYSGLLDK